MPNDDAPQSDQEIQEQLTEAQSGLILPTASPVLLPNGLGRRKMLKRVSLGMMAGLSASLPLSTSVLADSLAPSSDQSNGTPLPPDEAASSQHKGVVPSRPVVPTAASGTAQSYLGYDFRPISSTTTYTYVTFGGISWTGSGTISFWHRLQLPDGAKVTGVYFVYTDNDPTSRITVGMYRGLGDGSGDTIFTLSSTTPASTPRTLSKTGTAAAPIATIDNFFYGYQLGFFPTVGSTNHILWGAYVTYTNVTATFRVA